MLICLIADAKAVHTVKWAEYLSKKGHEVHLISYEPFSIPIDGVTIHIVKSFFNNLYLGFIPKHIRIHNIVKSIDPDIIHGLFVSKFGFHAALLKKKCPLVISAWGSDILIIPHRSKLLWFFTNLSLKKANLIYAASEDLKKKIIHYFNINPDLIKINIHGVDFSMFHLKEYSYLASEYKEILVCSNRSLKPVYNVKCLIDAIPKVISKNKNIKFLIIGTGPDENEIKDLTCKLGVEDYVSFIGRVDQFEMSDYLIKSDIYVSTSLSDGTPVSMLEAMACGLPCIMTDVGDVSKWIEDRFNGFLFCPGDSQLLADRIIELADDSKKRQTFGLRSYKKAYQNANQNNIMKSVLEDYFKLINEF